MLALLGTFSNLPLLDFLMSVLCDTTDGSFFGFGLESRSIAAYCLALLTGGFIAAF